MRSPSRPHRQQGRCLRLHCKTYPPKTSKQKPNQNKNISHKLRTRIVNIKYQPPQPEQLILQYFPVFTCTEPNHKTRKSKGLKHLQSSALNEESRFKSVCSCSGEPENGKEIVPTGSPCVPVLVISSLSVLPGSTPPRTETTGRFLSCVGGRGTTTEDFLEGNKMGK